MNGIEAACIGVLRNDAEVRTAKSGRPWLAIPLAVGEGDSQQYVAAGYYASGIDELAPQLKKGGSCYVEGKIKVKIWEKDGQPVPSIWLTANLVQPLGVGYNVAVRRQIHKSCAAAKTRASSTKGKAPRLSQPSLLETQAPIRGIDAAPAGAGGRPFDDDIPF